MPSLQIHELLSIDTLKKSNQPADFESLYEMLPYELYMNEQIDWDKVIKKEARGLDDYDLGEVEEVNNDTVITKKGVVDKDRFYLPRDKVSRFDGDKLWFEVTKDMAKGYRRD